MNLRSSKGRNASPGSGVQMMQSPGDLAHCRVLELAQMAAYTWSRLKISSTNAPGDTLTPTPCPDGGGNPQLELALT